MQEVLSELLEFGKGLGSIIGEIKGEKQEAETQTEEVFIKEEEEKVEIDEEQQRLLDEKLEEEKRE